MEAITSIDLHVHSHEVGSPHEGTPLSVEENLWEVGRRVDQGHRDRRQAGGSPCGKGHHMLPFGAVEDNPPSVVVEGIGSRLEAGRGRHSTLVAGYDRGSRSRLGVGCILP